MTPHKVRAAIIGLGRMGSTYDDEFGPFGRWQPPHAHAACYRALDSVELAAGADPHEGQREAFARKWGVDRDHLYSDYREMLERERPDVVSICTSAKPRSRILADILAAGAGVRAIWAEKPIAISLVEADQMVASCRLARIPLAVGASRCWDATYQRMRQLIEMGQLGALLQVIGMGRCGLSHNGSHLLSLVCYLSGAQCQWVFGHMRDDEEARGDNDLMGNGYLQFDNGVQGFVRGMPSGAADWEFEVIGTVGRLRAIHDAEEVDFWKLAPSDLEGGRPAPGRHLFPSPVTNESANVRALRDLLVCIESGKEPECGGDDGRHVLEIAIALRESHRRGGVRVDLPLSDRSLSMHSAETLQGDEPAIERRRRAAEAKRDGKEGR